MCRNITPLRGLEPKATPEEIEAAARQYVRKVGGLGTISGQTGDAVEAAVTAVARATAELLTALPPRRQPPATLPPLRRIARRSGASPSVSARGHAATADGRRAGPAPSSR
jgi:hypothetical protein